MVSASYVLRDNADFRSSRGTLQVFGDSSKMTLAISPADRSAALPEGAYIRLAKADGVIGNYGEAPLLADSDGTYRAEVAFDRAFGQTSTLTFIVYGADDTEMATLKFTLDSFVSASSTWPEPASTPPLPALTTQDAIAPGTTEPPYSTALVKCTYYLPVKPSGYSHYNATLRQYADLATLNVFFFYTGELPEGAYMRIVSADGVVDAYGSGAIGLANVEGTDPSLLGAKIITRELPAASTLTVECCSPDGELLFPLTFNIEGLSYPSGAQKTPGTTAYRDPYGNTNNNGSGAGNLLDGILGDPAPTPYSPTYNYNNWNNWYGNPTNNWGGFDW